MTRITIILLTAGLLIGAVALQRHLDGKATFEAATNELTHATTVTINHKVFEVEVADTLDSQTRGLSNRPSMATNHGMLFVFNPASSPSFWMRDMQFPLDFVWIYQGKVIGVTPNVPAPQLGTKPEDLPNYPAPGTVDNVLEINASQAQGITAGDNVVIKESRSI